MSLAKLTINHEKDTADRFDGRIEALFNPSKTTFSNTVSWRLDQSAMDSRIAEHRRLSLESIAPPSFTIELFFDTYEGDPRGALGLGSALDLVGSALALDPSATPNAVSVLTYTDQVVALAHYNKELHRPPVCELRWGRYSLFKGVLSTLSQEFSLFLEDGTPVRATLGCTFTEFETDDDAMGKELHSADVTKKYEVKPGDTLVNIAIGLYGDASRWRAIADANRLVDPRAIAPGQVIRIPPIR